MTMTYLMRRPLSTALAVASVTGGAILAGPQAAQAAGFELKEQSAIAQGNAYAGAGARSDDASMMYFNPASIARLKGYQISVGVGDRAEWNAGERHRHHRRSAGRPDL
jgi:long-chain fatty acid transport protein